MTQAMERSARLRWIRIFEYLRALDEHELGRKPIVRLDAHEWHMLCAELPSHTSVSGMLVPGCEDAEERVCLRVRQPQIAECPKPPDELLPWLKPGWDEVSRDPVFRESLTSEGGLHFDDAPGIRPMAENWLKERRAWKRGEASMRGAVQLYDQLYRLYARMQREGDRLEFMLGDGSVQADGRNVDHPLLLLKLQLTFDPSVPEFIVTAAGDAPDYYAAPLYAVRYLDLTLLQSLRSEQSLLGVSPLDSPACNAFLRRLAASLSTEVVSDTHSGEGMRLLRAPVLFLRRKATGYTQAILEILEQLRSEQPLPPALITLMGGDDAPIVEAEEDVPVLFPLPASRAQRRIALRMESAQALLVEGPPGTGKTHTIANLLAHFMAQGKRVLVTSSSARTLRALETMLSTELHTLCMGLLDDYSWAEDTIDELLEHSDAQEIQALTEEEVTFTAEYEGISQQIKQLRGMQREALENENQPIEVNGRAYTPAEAAAIVREQASDGWIPPPVRPGPLPLSQDEIHELYALGGAQPNEPDVDAFAMDLPLPEQFSHWVNAGEEEGGPLLGWWDLSVPLDETALLALQSNMNHILGGLEGWCAQAVEASLEGGAVLANYRALVLTLQALVAKWESCALQLADRNPQVPEWAVTDDQYGVLMAMCDYIQSNKKISRWALMGNPSWKPLYQAVRVDGHPMQSAEDAHIVMRQAELLHDVHTLQPAWESLMCSGGAVPLTRAMEEGLQPYIDRLEECLNFTLDTWQNTAAQLRALGLDFAGFLQMQPLPLTDVPLLDRLREAADSGFTELLQERMYGVRKREAQASLSALALRIARMDGGQALYKAIIDKDEIAYAQAYSRMRARQGGDARLERRKELIARLQEVAPQWAKHLVNGIGLHGAQQPPGDVNAAWLWRQLNDALERRRVYGVNTLKEQIMHSEEAQRRVCAKLVEARAWLHVARRLTPTHRQALLGWKDALRRTNSMSGERLEALKREARRNLSVCAGAVPAWIMPIDTVIEELSPANTRFDIIIVDEANEADLMALTVAYMADQWVIVGDEEQALPPRLGVSTDTMQRLIEEYLSGTPNAQLFDECGSLFDLVRRATQRLSLREQFRSVEAIAQYSSQLCYGGRTRTVRNSEADVRVPPIAPLHVPNGQNVNGVNEAEAQTIVALVRALFEQPEYSNASFGIISMLGEAQAVQISQLLHEHLDERTMRKHKLVCGTPMVLQGEERDIVILSLVEQLPILLPSDESARRQYNIAVSRACDQIWVVHSLDTDVLSPDDLRLGLVAPGMASELNAQHNEKGDMVEEIVERLRHRGFACMLQPTRSAADAVVRSGERIVGLVCEGAQYRGLRRMEERLEGQATLERMGWKMLRVNGTRFGRDPEGTVEEVINGLYELGVTPASHEETEAQSNAVYPRVLRRVTALLHEETPEAPPAEDKGKSFAPDLDNQSGQRMTLVEFFQKQKVPTVDERPRGGLFWAIGGRELSTLMVWLWEHNIHFVFKETGSQSTGGEPAWYTQSLL